MKSLLYREWLLMRKGFLISLGASLLTGLLMFLVRLSMQIGNLSHLEDMDSLNTVTYILFAFLMPLMLFTSLGVLNTHDADIKSGFQMMRYTLPVTNLQFIGAKYLYKAAVFLGALVLTVLWGLLLDATGQPEDLENTYPVIACLAAFLSMLADTVRCPLVLLTRTKRQLHVVNSVTPMIAPVLFYGVVLGVFTHEIKAWAAVHGEDDMNGLFEAMFEKYSLIIQNLQPLLLGGTFALLLLGFVLSLAAVKRREK